MRLLIATFVTLFTLSSSVTFAYDEMKQDRVPIEQCFKAFERGKVIYEFDDAIRLETFIVSASKLYLWVLNKYELSNTKRSTQFCNVFVSEKFNDVH